MVPYYFMRVIFSASLYGTDSFAQEIILAKIKAAEHISDRPKIGRLVAANAIILWLSAYYYYYYYYCSSYYTSTTTTVITKENGQARIRDIKAVRKHLYCWRQAVSFSEAIKKWSMTPMRRSLPRFLGRRITRVIYERFQKESARTRWTRTKLKFRLQ